MNETKSPYMQHSRHDDGRTINTKACCCNFYAEVLEKFKSLPKEKQIEILKNLLKVEEKGKNNE